MQYFTVDKKQQFRKQPYITSVLLLYMQSKKERSLLWNPRQIGLQTIQHNILIKFCCLWRIEMTQQQHIGLLHRLINYIDTKAKCRHIKKIYV